MIFSSPDEGRPPGTERLMWTAGSECVALLGRRFYVEEDFRLRNGECLYLVYRLTTHDLWCNAKQATTPRLSLPDAVRMGFELPVGPKDR